MQNEESKIKSTELFNSLMKFCESNMSRFMDPDWWENTNSICREWWGYDDRGEKIYLCLNLEDYTVSLEVFGKIIIYDGDGEDAKTMKKEAKSFFGYD